MLTITIEAVEASAGVEFYDELNELFVYPNPIKAVKEQKLKLEHSLVSLSKWESKWLKPFLGKDSKTTEETIDYIRCMAITQNVDPNVYLNLSDKNIKMVNDYIAAPMSATTFSIGGKGSSREIITAEIIYYWMVTLNIPFECQKWHFNKLHALIKVCNIKNTPPKKMGRGDMINKRRDLNAERRAAANSKG